MNWASKPFLTRSTLDRPRTITWSKIWKTVMVRIATKTAWASMLSKLKSRQSLPRTKRCQKLSLSKLLIITKWRKLAWAWMNSSKRSIRTQKSLTSRFRDSRTSRSSVKLPLRPKSTQRLSSRKQFRLWLSKSLECFASQLLLEPFWASAARNSLEICVPEAKRDVLRRPRQKLVCNLWIKIPQATAWVLQAWPSHQSSALALPLMLSLWPIGTITWCLLKTIASCKLLNRTATKSSMARMKKTSQLHFPAELSTSR